MRINYYCNPFCRRSVWDPPARWPGGAHICLHHRYWMFRWFYAQFFSFLVFCLKIHYCIFIPTIKYRSSSKFWDFFFIFLKSFSKCQKTYKIRFHLRLPTYILSLQGHQNESVSRLPNFVIFLSLFFQGSTILYSQYFTKNRFFSTGKKRTDRMHCMPEMPMYELTSGF